MNDDVSRGGGGGVSIYLQSAEQSVCLSRVFNQAHWQLQSQQMQPHWKPNWAERINQSRIKHDILRRIGES